MLTHLDENNLPSMVDISHKTTTSRAATAQCIVAIPQDIVALFRDGEIHSPKGPVFHTAIIAGTMAAKNTAGIIPLCHSLSIESCHIDIALQDNNDIVITSVVGINNKTGVEMEALVAVNIAALTIYDMCKGVSRDIVIKESRLMKKSGGKSDAL